MKRILILGCSGAGKSTLARRLGKILNLPVIHMDVHFWQAGWVVPRMEAWRETVARLVREDAWVMEGNFAESLDLRLPACDTVLFLDFPRWRCFPRIFRRWIKWRGRTRPDLPEGCPEQWDWRYLNWVWNYPRKTLPATLNQISRFGAGKPVTTLRSPDEVEAFLLSLSSR